MQITIIGCGNMGTALAQRLSKGCRPFLFDKNAEKAKALQQEGYGQAVDKLTEAVQKSDYVFLAVKPQNLMDAAKMVQLEQQGPILISLLAGTSLAKLKQHFPKFKLARMMPNLAMICGEGAIGLAADDAVSKEEQDRMAAICGQLGKVYWLPESKFDAFTALAGSGPAFVFALVEAMVDAGINIGFDAATSEDIVCQMMKGSVSLLDSTGKHPAQLRWQVASPGGTTIAGLRRLEELALRGGVMETFAAAYDRAKNLNP